LRITHLASAALLAGLLGGCYALSESPGGPVPSYWDIKNAPKLPELTPEELAQCPKPNGVFQNQAGGYGLENLFFVSGFQFPASNLPGGRHDDPPLAASMSADNLLGGVDENGIRKPYRSSTGERFTFELRPLGGTRFQITVFSSLGQTAKGEGVLAISRSRDGTWTKRCENGALNSYYKKRLDRSFFVDPASGDLLLLQRDYRKPLDQTELSFSTRFKRIGN
jgi:hypothetical protein